MRQPVTIHAKNSTVIAAVAHCAAVALFLCASLASAQDKWTIHEWGTFTSLQNESGQTLGGINTDDEPVPRFVHRLAGLLLLPAHEVPLNFFQGAPACHPDVTMRLETPVIYFHPPKSQPPAATADVLVKFRGGWLTEFFPDANADAPGLQTGNFHFGPLRSDTISSLEWKDLKIGGNGDFPQTSSHVWTSPRAVDAASVEAHLRPETRQAYLSTQSQPGTTESERFLFYRGVAHIDAPLKISRDKDSLILQSQLPTDADFRGKSLHIQKLWLVQIKPNGKLAFRTLPPVAVGSDPNQVLARTPATFDYSQFSASNLQALRSSLRDALVADGLFDDEAQALLNTWELSYFKSDGLRLFFLVPRAWTDYYLPLNISLPAQINRVMVGRIELVTPEQRKLLNRLASFSADDVRTQATQLGATFPTLIPHLSEVENGTKHLRETISVPPTYQTFLNLGRFRTTLVQHEAQAHPTPGLTNFVRLYRLHE